MCGAYFFEFRGRNLVCFVIAYNFNGKFAPEGRRKQRRHARALRLSRVPCEPGFKDVRAHCYCASLVRTLFIRHVGATSFSSACTESKTQQNIELMTFVLTWCANIFVGCSVTPTFFSADHFLS